MYTNPVCLYIYVRRLYMSLMYEYSKRHIAVFSLLEGLSSRQSRRWGFSVHLQLLLLQLVNYRARIHLRRGKGQGRRQSQACSPGDSGRQMTRAEGPFFLSPLHSGFFFTILEEATSAFSISDLMGHPLWHLLLV